MAFLTKEKLFSKKWFLSYSFILFGAFIMAVGFVFFISPYKLAPGGVYGIAIVIHHLTVGMFDFLPDGLPIGITALCMDIPLTIIGIKILGPKFGIKTVIGFVSLAVFVDLLEFYWGNIPLVENEPLLSAIFGGALVGIGLGLIFKSRATSGGSDIIAMIIAKYTKLPLGQLLIYIDSVIVMIGLLAFQDWAIPLLSWLVIYITGKVIDVVLEGVGYEKALLIISEKYQEIRNKIINDLERGGTFINAKGMFNDADKKIIYVVLNRREVAILKEYISEVDNKAFVTVIDAHEILGEGFKPLKDVKES